mmetsp:Transcript_32688/g.98332  ORF Transcript_32688/g.98332 Transcript_32688/m.98332 type:complete len:211 (+) Transcript_32688:27-659(+)
MDTVGRRVGHSHGRAQVAQQILVLPLHEAALHPHARVGEVLADVVFDLARPDAAAPLLVEPLEAFLAFVRRIRADVARARRRARLRHDRQVVAGPRRRQEPQRARRQGRGRERRQQLRGLVRARRGCLVRGSWSEAEARLAAAAKQLERLVLPTRRRQRRDRAGLVAVQRVVEEGERVRRWSHVGHRTCVRSCPGMFSWLQGLAGRSKRP